MTLEKRKYRSDLIETFKIVNDCCNLNSDLFFTYDEGQRRGHSKTQQIGFEKVCIQQVDHWNALSDACVTSNTITQFKNCLKRELQPETHS